jgi:alcohol dehydrogenase class IV
MAFRFDFRAVSYPLRVYSGEDALEHLSAEVARAKSSRVLMLCGNSVATRTDLPARVRGILGDKLAGVYSGLRKDAPLDCVMEAVAAAREHGADLLLAVGAGSVLKATRIVAILLAETRPLRELVTQYPESGRAISPRLLAPKMPIINVLTAPTTAQNRAGAALKEGASGERLEFFDPKARPLAIFWDAAALLTAPPSLMRNNAAAIYWRALMNRGLADSANPLVQGERLQAFRLAAHALCHAAEPNVAPRIELCAAAFLQNREEDEGRRLNDTHWVARVVYALGASTFHLCETVGQGEAYASLTGAALRVFGARDPQALAGMGEALGVAGEAEAVAGTFENLCSSLGLASRLRGLGVTRDALPVILQHSLTNFNADANREFLGETDGLSRVLKLAW